MRIMGLDYGSKTIGVAISDPFGWTAQAIETIERDYEENLKGSLQRIEVLIAEYEIEKIVVGMPYNMNHTEGERVEKTEIFIKRLKKFTKKQVETVDERLTTKMAERTLTAGNVHKKDQKKVIDKVAAALILQLYLDAHHE